MKTPLAHNFPMHKAVDYTLQSYKHSQRISSLANLAVCHILQVPEDHQYEGQPKLYWIEKSMKNNNQDHFSHHNIIVTFHLP